MNYAVITENDVSRWKDETGVKYHFPSSYLAILTPGTKVIYYKGRMTDKTYQHLRLSTESHYFGSAVIGEVVEDIDSKNNYFAEIKEFRLFSKAVPFKAGDQYLEEIPENRKQNYWRFGVRQISDEVYKRILSSAEYASTSDSEFNDNESTEQALTSAMPQQDGGEKRFYTTKYERNQALRDEAIRVHGYSCMVCEINFKDTYGDWGEGFIHVHHKTPLSSSKEKIDVNPKTDLAVVCPNCHSMIHRKKKETLTIEQLKQKIRR